MCAHKPEHIMNITNEKNIQIRIYRFTAIIIIIMLLLLLNTYKFRIVKNYNESNFSPEIKEINLSAEDKLKEFDFIYEILTVNMPSITLFNEKYGINFIENYDNYRSYVSNTKDDFDYDGKDKNDLDILLKK